MAPQKVVSVAGTSRSGSTVLHLILGSAPSSFACGEVASVYRPEYRGREPECPCGDDPCPVWTSVFPIPAREFHAHALEVLQVAALIDSSKDADWIVDTRRWLRRVPDVEHEIVLIWKDPYALAYSFWKRTGSVDTWKRPFVRYHRRALSLDERLVSVEYGQLFSDPRAQLERLCDRLGIPFDNAMLEFWKQPHHHLYGSLSARLQVESGDGRLGVRTTYPQEFLDAAGGLEDAINADPEVQDVISGLRSFAIDAGDSDKMTHPRVPPIWAWYPRSRARSFLRGYRGREKDTRTSVAAARDTLEWARSEPDDSDHAN